MLKNKSKANYLTTGAWSKAAAQEARKYCEVNDVSLNKKFNTIPDIDSWNIDKDAAYFHYCDNETVNGVEFDSFPYEKLEG